MHEAVMARADAADVVVMAAAVADYTPLGGADAGKIEKGASLTLMLERTADILADLGRRRNGGARPVLIGFAAQAGHPVDQARKKLESKRVDLIVANDVLSAGSGFNVDTNQITLVSHAGAEALPLLSKDDAAAVILDRVERLLAQPAPATPVP
jgi:phosphopantothenoylcysteine decarboxylase/phosphopantothenate--cysteine ligase